jgi:hypothetical protein
MKTKHALIIFLFGYCLDFIGGLFKILHFGEADAILIIATILKVFGVLFFLIKLNSYQKIKEFLNS